MKILISFLLFLASSSLFAQRQIGYQIDMTENMSYDSAYGYCADACMQFTSQTLQWSQLETSEGVWNADGIGLANVMNIYYPAVDMPLMINFAVTNTVVREVPEDLMDINFDDVVMIDRFKTFVDTLFAHMPDVEMVAINIGNETDVMFGTDESEYLRFKTFLEAVRPYVKEKYFDLHGVDVPIGTTFTFGGIISPFAGDLCKFVNQNLDIITTNYYPLDNDFIVHNPIAPISNLDYLVDFYADLPHPIVFQECGYPSSSECGSSESMQADFITNLFTAWDTHSARITHISFFKSTDWDAALAATIAEYYGFEDNPAFVGYLASVGLRTWPGNGTNKPAYERLLCELNARSDDFCEANCSIDVEENPKVKVSLYPNPTHDRIAVSTKGHEPISSFRVWNSSGRVEKEKTFPSDGLIDVSYLTAGAYTIELKSADTFTIARFIVVD